MNLSRRNFLGGTLAAGTIASLGSGCASLCKCCRPGKVAVQLYSIKDYIKNVGLEKALADVRAIGYEGVEFAGYWNFTAKQIRKMLDDNGLVACGTHCPTSFFSPEKYKETCEFNREMGNKFICSPWGGNYPPQEFIKDKVMDESLRTGFLKELCEFYNQAAENCAQYGCLVGLHNHTWEFDLKFADGTTFWDFFFSNTSKKVQMEQDVGWTTCAGYDPCIYYTKYAGRSYTLHAKENGMGPNVTKFDAILGQPGQPGAKGVDWDAVAKAADADNVQWWVVECERHFDSLDAIKPSFEFLKSKGRC